MSSEFPILHTLAVRDQQIQDAGKFTYNEKIRKLVSTLHTQRQSFAAATQAYSAADGEMAMVKERLLVLGESEVSGSTDISSNRRSRIAHAMISKINSKSTETEHSTNIFNSSGISTTDKQRQSKLLLQYNQKLRTKLAKHFQKIAQVTPFLQIVDCSKEDIINVDLVPAKENVIQQNIKLIEDHDTSTEKLFVEEKHYFSSSETGNERILTTSETETSAMPRPNMSPKSSSVLPKVRQVPPSPKTPKMSFSKYQNLQEQGNSMIINATSSMRVVDQKIITAEYYTNSSDLMSSVEGTSKIIKPVSSGILESVRLSSKEYHSISEKEQEIDLDDLNKNDNEDHDSLKGSKYIIEESCEEIASDLNHDKSRIPSKNNEPSSTTNSTNVQDNIPANGAASYTSAAFHVSEMTPSGQLWNAHTKPSLSPRTKANLLTNDFKTNNFGSSVNEIACNLLPHMSVHKMYKTAIEQNPILLTVNGNKAEKIISDADRMRILKFREVNVKNYRVKESDKFGAIESKERMEKSLKSNPYV